MNDPVRILLVDDHALFRLGVRALLERRSGAYEVVGEASTGEEAVAKTRELLPDIAVMDLSMPETDGLEATRRISALDRDTRVLILTVHEEEKCLVPALEAGASGYLTKTSADSELFEALDVLGRGEAYLPESARTRLRKHYNGRPRERGSALDELSSREKEVVALTAEGFSSREIGSKLRISGKTVETYRWRAMKKLDLSHRSEVVHFALRTGLLADV